MEKKPWLNILGKPTEGNMQPCEKSRATDQSVLFSQKTFKTIQIPLRLLAEWEEIQYRAQRNPSLQKNNNMLMWQNQEPNKTTV